MEQLRGYFQQAASFINSYSYTLTHSEILKQYFRNENNPYRELELVDNLQDTISILQQDNTNYSSLAISDSNFDILYYAENSDDPFADIDPKITQYLRETFTATKQATHTSYVRNSQGEGMLVKYQALDKRTLDKPLSYNQNNVFFVVFAVSLESFNNLRRQIEFNNQTAIIFTDHPIFHANRLIHSVRLYPGLYATVDPATFLLESKLDSIWNDLVYACLSSAIITLILILVLLNLNVTRPISRLDEQLREVENKQRANIDKLKSDDEVGRLSVRFFDMYQELTNTYQRTKLLAESDHLTGLMNRHHYQHLVVEQLPLLTRNKKAWILYIDLDNFKFVNDKYGHKVGDALLVNFSERLIKLTTEFHQRYKGISFASRLSGDEFSVIVSGLDNNSVPLGEVFAKELLEPMQDGFVSDQGTFPITASIGISCYPEDSNKFDRLVSNADTAMYLAKSRGKNQFANYSLDLDKAVQRRGDIERALRDNCVDSEFSLVFMPILDQKGVKTTGVEALLRWHSPSLGFVSPAEFIPIAEQTGLFEKIDKWVIESAFSQYHTINQLLEDDIHISINLSAAELISSSGLGQYIADKAEQYRVPPQHIEFEITETFATDSQAYPLLEELSAQGFKLAIDDFGSGYTSFTQLVKYPVQKIKLDRLFLLSLEENQKTQIIGPLIELCHSQSMTVTAEGIETAAMHQWLTKANCDYMQGFYFGQPMSISELNSWYKNRQGIEQ
ncbi:putative bifunctional diguanylate cyclase/phosphodiesterase [Vibrio maerlii]|uniref:putative bifunctional diguanylate cyclase/phosphodiesterase n=1 Tax=Vibrio maerlii TaxID=2231648 RepID=UPI001F12B4E8|nr:bifunctional diguanylate cyclase/phosphodiesterase [Vibrio maerlii]